ncbi:hypothetical protein OPIT5_08390 [Opitutaceae bacterium TAV5]|nr:hypothetical protein OPIT5_08390 [Opitutaceae bacterium TAV5]
MSFLFGGGNNTASAAPKIGGLDNSNLSSNEQAVPVPWCSGEGIFPLTWVVPEVYNLVTVKERKKVSKKKVTVGINYYGDVAGIACLGLIDRVTMIESGDKVIWEGDEARSDVPGHRNYWRAAIATDIGTFYVYWGRPDQPVDDIVLASLGAKDPALAHPAYRRQALVVVKRYYFGLDSTTVPNTRIRLHRAPRPAVGNFPPMIAASDQATRDKAAKQGESIVAAILELLTDGVFGAGLPARHFVAAEWEALSAAVAQKAGLHSPFIDRTRKVRDAVKDYLSYFDGYIRIDNGVLRPGMFPHDGQVPGLAAELTEHDYESKPSTTSTAPSRAVNEVQVSYRDSDDRLKTRVANASAADSVQARRAHEPRRVDMPGIIDGAQAASYAARAAAVASEGTFTGSVDLRRATAGNGDPLKPGDIVRFVYSPFAIDRIVRITGRSDPWRGPASIDFEAEHGLFAALPPAKVEPRPQPGDRIPYPITKARVYELPEGLLANAEGSLSGIAVAFLAMRPRSYYEDMPAMTGLDVIAFDVWDSATGASYDPLGESQRGWAVRATLSAALPGDDTDAAVQIAIDPDNIDQDRITEQSAAAQANDTLLLIIGEEVMSVGAINAAGLNWTLPGCLRARLDSAAEAHAAGKVAWLVYADDVTPLSHKQWTPDTDRRFKLQPRTASDVLELSQAPVFVYHFKPATAAAPVAVTLEPVPAAAAVGDMLTVSGEATAPSGNLATVAAVWMRLGEGDAPAGEQTLSMVVCSGAQKSVCPVATMAVMMAPGRYRAEIRAVNAAGATTKATSGVVVVGAAVVPEEPEKQVPTIAAQILEPETLTLNGAGNLHLTVLPVQSHGRRHLISWCVTLGLFINAESEVRVVLELAVARAGGWPPGESSSMDLGKVRLRRTYTEEHTFSGTMLYDPPADLTQYVLVIRGESPTGAFYARARSLLVQDMPGS